MIEVTYQAKTYRLPSTWEEVTTAQYLRICFEWEGDPTDLFEIFTGVSIRDQTDPKLDKLSALAGSFALTPQPDFESLVEADYKQWTVAGKTIICPRIGDLTVAQRTHFFATLQQMNIEDSTGAIAQFFPDCLGIVFAPFYFEEKFTVERARELTALILDEPIVNTFGIGGFFFGKLISSKVYGARDLRGIMRAQIVKEKLSSKRRKFRNLKL